MRILFYAGLLVNDMDVFDLLPDEALEQVVLRLDCRFLKLLCQASTRFAALCRSTRIWRLMVQQRGYRASLAEANIETLKALCARLEQRESGTVYAFGRNDHGQLGTGDEIDRAAPSPILLPPVIQVSAGSSYSLCLTGSGAVYAFGANSFGQLGLGDMEDRIVPTTIPALRDIIQVAASPGSLNQRPKKGPRIGEMEWDAWRAWQQMPVRGHSLCLSAAGHVYAFGRNSSSQLGLGHPLRK